MRNSYLVALVSIMLLSLRPTYAEVEGIGRVLGRYTVKSIQFSFVGKRTYKDKKLLAKLSFKKGDDIDAILADFGREDVEEFYLKRGFAFVEVQLDKKSVREGDVIYTIKEGPRVRIKSVKFRGNNAIKTGRLKKAAKTNKKKWFFWRKHYSEEKVSADVERLLNVYLEKGFLDCRITEKQEFTADRRVVHLIFVIEEGPVYIVERVVLKGAERIYSIDIDGLFDEEALRTRLRLEEGKHYRKRQAESDRKKLLELFHEYGFVDARVNLHIDKVFGDEEAGPRVEAVSKAGVNVEFEIFEGQQFRIGRIDIVGNKQTQDKVIRRVLNSFGFQPGQYYNSDVARGDGSGELETEIRRRVYTEETTITAMTGHEPGQKNVDVQVKEGQTGQWILSAGISSDSGIVGGVILEQRNFDFNDWPEDFREFITGQAFKGAGQSFRISLMPGTELSQYSVSFTEPYFRDQPVSMDLTGLDTVWIRESYDEGRTKGYIGFGEQHERRYKSRWRRSIGFRAENVDVDNIDLDAPKEIKDVKGNNGLAGIRFGIGKDLTYGQFMPSKGYSINASYEQVTGDHTFGILSGTYKWYRTIYEDLAERKTILSSRLRAATVLGDAPPFEKFYAGGIYSIRGFEYRGVSTRGLQTNVADPKRIDPIGSDWVFLANAEITAPLVGESLSALFLVDSGTIDSGSYRASVGTGIQILIPHWFGPVPMRIGVAAPILKDDLDETQAFFFSAGGLF